MSPRTAEQECAFLTTSMCYFMPKDIVDRVHDHDHFPAPTRCRVELKIYFYLICFTILGTIIFMRYLRMHYQNILTNDLVVSRKLKKSS